MNSRRPTHLIKRSIEGRKPKESYFKALTKNKETDNRRPIELTYELREEIFENGRVRCPAFSVAPIIYDSDGDELESELQKGDDSAVLPGVVKAR